MQSPKFVCGDKVFAKVKGFPPWPAEVVEVSDENKKKRKYSVYFYGTKEKGACIEGDLCSYVNNRGILGKFKKSNSAFNKSVIELDSTLGFVPFSLDRGRTNTKHIPYLRETRAQHTKGLNSLNRLNVEEQLSKSIEHPIPLQSRSRARSRSKDHRRSDSHELRTRSRSTHPIRRQSRPRSCNASSTKLPTSFSMGKSNLVSGQGICSQDSNREIYDELGLISRTTGQNTKGSKSQNLINVKEQLSNSVSLASRSPSRSRTQSGCSKDQIGGNLPNKSDSQKLQSNPPIRRQSNSMSEIKYNSPSTNFPITRSMGKSNLVSGQGICSPDREREGYDEQGLISKTTVQVTKESNSQNLKDLLSNSISYPSPSHSRSRARSKSKDQRGGNLLIKSDSQELRTRSRSNPTIRRRSMSEIRYNTDREVEGYEKLGLISDAIAQNRSNIEQLSKEPIPSTSNSDYGDHGKLEQKPNRHIAQIEIRLLDIVMRIVRSLTENHAALETCLKLLDDLDLQLLEVTPLMLKKHPEIVDALNKLQIDTVNTSEWEISDEEITNFFFKVTQIKQKSQMIYFKIQSLFCVPFQKTFLEFFNEEVKRFDDAIKNLSTDDLLRLTEDPTINRS